MENEELIKKLRECRELNKQLESLCKTTIEPNSPLKEWLDETERDINDNIVPERIKTIISHNIESLNLQRKVRYYSRIPTFPVEAFTGHWSELIASGFRFRNAYRLYKSVGYVERNTVLVGANGSGKTSLANVLKGTLNNMDGIVIPAQKLLLVPTFVSIPTLSSEEESFSQYQRDVFDDKTTYEARNNDDFPYDEARKYGGEFRKVLAFLIAERNAKRNELLDEKEDGTIFKKADFKTTIDVVIDIWNDLIPHRKMCVNPDSNLILEYIDKNTAETRWYDAYRMSDGERVILYLIGRVLQAPKDGLIVVDEPEMYLHRTVVDRLWNRLEKERNDCTFVYMTHDLQFATSREGIKSWIKSYQFPNEWDIQVIEKNEIPEQLLLELLGSCKNILFCEGTAKSSLDKKIFEILFPSYIIYPLESCKEVINYTRAFNSLPNINTKALGIVDSDFRTPEEIADLKASSIYTYQVAEIENLFLVESFLSAFNDYYHFEGDIEKIKTGIIEMLNKNKEAQCSNYITSRIDYYYRKNHIVRRNTKEEVKKEVDAFNSDITIDAWYKKRMRELELYIEKQKYDKVIAVYNNKGLHSIVENEFKIANFQERALQYLKVAPEEVVDALRRVFPTEVWSS